MKKSLLFLFGLCFLFAIQGQAQDYSRSVGVRGGLGANVTYKQFVGPESAFELLGGFYFGDVYASLTYEKHNAFTNDVRGLTWYWGIGASVLLSSGGIGIGGLGAIGLDYAFGDIPLNISLDWMPHLYLIGGNGFEAGGGGFSLRYILER
ncbi:hypothetical protein KUV50_12730 [Membranicola marinus]|uniref:Outer membrane protein beta-barrel domain-containing protein n=1 Tax=Membranihabitans marinus TaxID=1227546 RepID=A0A953LAS8_9BACT|nr:hypothetical protein [Membranihabitans marinus]MBY5959008.1 hypothetical protein [Membranihabitans marinus]